MLGKYTTYICLSLSCLTIALMIWIISYARRGKYTCLQTCLPCNNSLCEVQLNVFCSLIAGVPVMQHPAMSWLKEDHTLDSLDARQHLRQRRALWAAFPLHLQSSHPRSQPARSRQAEDRDALLLQRRIHRLLHWRWVQSGRDRWSFSSYLSLWMFPLSRSNWLSASLQVSYWPPRLKPFLLSVCVCCSLDLSFCAVQSFPLSVLQKLKRRYLNQLSCLWSRPPRLYQMIKASDMLMNFQSTKPISSLQLILALPCYLSHSYTNTHGRMHKVQL